MKYTIEFAKAQPKTLQAEETTVGKLYKLLIDDWKDNVVLRVYDSFIDLKNPSRTWSVKCTSHYFQEMPVGTTVTLVQE